MKLLTDFFPVIFFFLTYKFFGIFAATLVAMVASLAQLVFHWFKHRKVEFIHLLTFFFVVVLGGATLFFHNDMFIKLKPTVIYWSLALVFLGSQFISSKTIMQRMLGAKLNLPGKTWCNLNLSWVLFFIGVGFLNLFVVYHYDTDTWVNFKMFGVLGLTLVFGFLQSLYMAKFLEDKPKVETES